LDIDIMADEILSTQSLREKLDAGQKGIVIKFAKRIDEIESIRFLIGCVGLVGTALVGFSRLLDTSTPGGWGSILLIIGIVIAALAGILLVMMDRRKLDITLEAKTVHEIAENAIKNAEKAETNFTELQSAAKALDDRRSGRLKAWEEMVGVVEAALITKGYDDKAAQAMLAAAIENIRRAIDYMPQDSFTLTIYRCETSGSIERAYSIASQWTNPAAAKSIKEYWEPNDGFTGHAWANAKGTPTAELILADTWPENVARLYPRKGEFNREREKLYRSVATIPILTQGKNQVWGVVTATTSRKDVFNPNEEAGKVQNVAMIRDVASVAALLAGLPRAADRIKLPRHDS
jgi:hypothetical protein